MEMASVSFVSTAYRHQRRKFSVQHLITSRSPKSGSPAFLKLRVTSWVPIIIRRATSLIHTY